MTCPQSPSPSSFLLLCSSSSFPPPPSTYYTSPSLPFPSLPFPTWLQTQRSHARVNKKYQIAFTCIYLAVAPSPKMAPLTVGPAPGHTAHNRKPPAGTAHLKIGFALLKSFGACAAITRNVFIFLAINS